jgi:hypothetical protein
MTLNVTIRKFAHSVEPPCSAVEPLTPSDLRASPMIIHSIETIYLNNAQLLSPEVKARLVVNAERVFHDISLLNDGEILTPEILEALLIADGVNAQAIAKAILCLDHAQCLTPESLKAILVADGANAEIIAEEIVRLKDVNVPPEFLKAFLETDGEDPHKVANQLILSYVETILMPQNRRCLEEEGYHSLASIPMRMIRQYLELRCEIIKPSTDDDCNGSVNLCQAKSVCQKLNDNPEHVLFHVNTIDGYLEGGACSAMSFDFVDNYLKKRQKMSPEEAIEAIGDNYRKCSEFFRSVQAAFNTICKDPQNPVDDFKKAKIAAMMRLYDRNVIAVSDEINLQNDPMKTLQKINSILKKFSKGVFIIRCIQSANNSKDENYGHSMVLIRDQEKQYFYNPENGVYQLMRGYEDLFLSQFLYDVNNHWAVPKSRFYQIVECH